MSTLQDSSASSTALAQALLELADERQQVDAVGGEMAAIAQTLRETPELAPFLASPSIKDADRAAVLERTIIPQSSPLVAGFLRLLVGKGQLGQLGQIADAYAKLLDQRAGRVDVDVIVARPLSGQQLDEVRDRVSRALNKSANVNQKVDESILGGIIVRYGDKLIDGSVRSQLKAIEDKMLAATV